LKACSKVKTISKSAEAQCFMFSMFIYWLRTRNKRTTYCFDWIFIEIGCHEKFQNFRIFL